MGVCSVCATENPSGARYCGMCGTSFPSVQPTAPVTATDEVVAAPAAAQTSPPATRQAPRSLLYRLPPAILILFWLGLSLVIYYSTYKELLPVIFLGLVAIVILMFQARIVPLLERWLSWLPQMIRLPLIAFIPFALYLLIMFRSFSEDPALRQEALSILFISALLWFIVLFGQSWIDRPLRPVWVWRDHIPEIIRIALSLSIPFGLNYLFSIIYVATSPGANLLGLLNFAKYALIISLVIGYILVHDPGPEILPGRQAT